MGSSQMQPILVEISTEEHQQAWKKEKEKHQQQNLQDCHSVTTSLPHKTLYLPA
jgi:hypothetical protein